MLGLEHVWKMGKGSCGWGSGSPRGGGVAEDEAEAEATVMAGDFGGRFDEAHLTDGRTLWYLVSEVTAFDEDENENRAGLWNSFRLVFQAGSFVKNRKVSVD